MIEPPKLRECDTSERYCGNCQHSTAATHALRRYCCKYHIHVNRFQICQDYKPQGAAK